MMWAQVRIWTIPEAALADQAFPESILDARFQQGLRYAVVWASNSHVSCALCGELLGGKAAYLAVLMPLEVELGLGTSSAVCMKCGEAPRAEVMRGVERSALLMFGPEMGHA